jgi:branched-chain amino acid transport system permease protein
MVFIGLAVLLLVAPFVAYPVFLMKVLCFALFACAFNLLLGYGGLLSFGHAAYFGMASYVSAYTAKTWGLTPELAILLGTLTAAALGARFGSLAHPPAGDLLREITLALAQMGSSSLSRRPSPAAWTHPGRSPRHLFGLVSLAGRPPLYWLVAAIFLLRALLIYRIIHSPFGRVLKAIRDNEPARSRSATGRASTSSPCFVLSATSPGSPAPPRRSCSSSPPSPMSTGRCRAKWC